MNETKTTFTARDLLTALQQLTPEQLDTPMELFDSHSLAMVEAQAVQMPFEDDPAGRLVSAIRDEDEESEGGVGLWPEPRHPASRR